MTDYLLYPFVLIKKCSLALEKAKIALFLDSGPTVTMIKHIMIASKKVIQYLISDQVPVVAMEQPQYALAIDIAKNKGDCLFFSWVVWTLRFIWLC